MLLRIVIRNTTPDATGMVPRHSRNTSAMDHEDRV